MNFAAAVGSEPWHGALWLPSHFILLFSEPGVPNWAPRDHICEDQSPQQTRPSVEKCFFFFLIFFFFCCWEIGEADLTLSHRDAKSLAG